MPVLCSIFIVLHSNSYGICTVIVQFQATESGSVTEKTFDQPSILASVYSKKALQLKSVRLLYGSLSR